MSIIRRSAENGGETQMETERTERERTNHGHDHNHDPELRCVAGHSYSMHAFSDEYVMTPLPRKRNVTSNVTDNYSLVSPLFVITRLRQMNEG